MTIAYIAIGFAFVAITALVVAVLWRRGIEAPGQTPGAVLAEGVINGYLSSGGAGFL